MIEALLIITSTALINNFILSQFLGLCPFMGTSKRPEVAIGMGLATTLVLTLSAVLSYLLWNYVLQPLNLEYLRIISFIMVIAAVVSSLESFLYKSNPQLYQMMGVYLPLITTNCAVLGVAVLNINQNTTLLSSLWYGLGASLGFTLVLAQFSTIRERLEAADVPSVFKGTPIAFITAGFMAIAFMGFAGVI